MITINTKFKNQMTRWVVCSLLLLAGLYPSKASSQCIYLSADNSDQSSFVIIPSDFPVINFEKASVQEKNDFNKLVIDWKNSNHVATDLSFIPSKGQFINIPKAEFDSFDKSRQEIILAQPTFYLVQSK